MKVRISNRKVITLMNPTTKATKRIPPGKFDGFKKPDPFGDKNKSFITFPEFDDFGIYEHELKEQDVLIFGAK